ncbi:unnamed protein product [Allacma fusca]|uniref:Uncharacterized protein n=1 Tax=Allacma fusca TaxID=39272 RepID=A0A8J2KW77_9HEXA|nr:unnamed protein product [Allacma fusca]
MEYELPEAASSVAWSVVPPSFGNPFPSFGSTEEFIPGRTPYNLEKRLGYAWDSTSEDMPFDLTNEHPPIEEPGVLPSSQALTAFVDDMKKFFLLVSLLDYDGCLQKVVCDVHCKGPEESLTNYESNIILTFELMNSILPMDEEDSTTKFRRASKIGELTKNAQLCAKAYPSCTYSTEEIIKMGNLASAEENVTDANHLLPATEPMNVNTAAPEDKDRSDQVPSAVTAMPRV